MQLAGCLLTVSAHNGEQWHMGTSQTLLENGGSDTLLIAITIIYYYSTGVMLLIILFDLALYNCLSCYIIDCHLCRQDHMLQQCRNTTSSLHFTDSQTQKNTVTRSSELLCYKYHKIPTFLPVSILGFSVMLQ